jgi:hypothetical protein
VRRLTHCQGRNAQRWPKRRRRPALDGSRKSRAHRSYRHLGRSRAPILIVNPSLGLTQASTPAVRGPLAGPASKHAAAHLGVWKAEGGAARPIADRVNGIRVSRTRTATRFNRLSVEGSALIFQGISAYFSNLAFCRVPSAENASLVGVARKAYLGRSTLREVSAAARGMFLWPSSHRSRNSPPRLPCVGRSRGRCFPDLGRGHAGGVVIAVDPVELDAFSGRSDDKKGPDETIVPALRTADCSNRGHRRHCRAGRGEHAS